MLDINCAGIQKSTVNEPIVPNCPTNPDNGRNNVQLSNNASTTSVCPRRYLVAMKKVLLTPALSAFIATLSLVAQVELRADPFRLAARMPHVGIAFPLYPVDYLEGVVEYVRENRMYQEPVCIFGCEAPYQRTSERFLAQLNLYPLPEYGRDLFQIGLLYRRAVGRDERAGGDVLWHSHVLGVQGGAKVIVPGGFLVHFQAGMGKNILYERTLRSAYARAPYGPEGIIWMGLSLGWRFDFRKDKGPRRG